MNNLEKNTSGFVLVAVIVITLILAVVVISFLSMTTSQTVTGQSVVDEVVSEQLAIGAFYQQHQNNFSDCRHPSCTTSGDCSTCPATTSANLNGKDYNINVNVAGAGGGLNQTHTVQTTVSY